METLAFLHLALAYEDPNPSPNLRFKDTDFRAATSVAMGFIASGIVASTLTYADAARANLYYGSRGSDVAKLQEALGNIAVDGIFGRETLARLKFYQAEKGLMVDGIAGSETLSSLEWSSSSNNSNGQDVGIGKGRGDPEQYGKLQLINDTTYMAIVLLYEPGSEQPSRYAYIPPCYQRTLLDTYSSSWKISFNQNGVFSIAEKANNKNDVFELKLSKVNEKNIPLSLCEYDNPRALTAKPVVNLNPFSGLADELFKLSKSQIPRTAKPIINQVINKAKKLSNNINRGGYYDDIMGKANLSHQSQVVDQTIDVTVAALLRQDEVGSYSPHLVDVAAELRLKHLAGQLNLDDPKDPNHINKILEKWKKDCPDTLLPVLVGNLNAESIKHIKLFWDSAVPISETVASNLPKPRPNNSFPTVTSALFTRLRNCFLAQSQHPIFVNSDIQSHRIPKKCI